MLPPLPPFLKHPAHTPAQVVKIGEGTYGEAFKSGQVVLKFVPMVREGGSGGGRERGAIVGVCV